MKKAVAVGILLILMRCLVGNCERLCSSCCSTLGMLNTSPGKSCSDIYQNNKASRMTSGNYWIQTDNGTIQQVYCDMELDCGGHKGGWMRVAQLNVTNGDTCPGDWINDVNYNSLCTVTGEGCHSANFSVPYSYNKICGQVRGFQKGTTDAFYPFFFSQGSTPSGLYTPFTYSATVNGVYVDGVSITLGDPRKHIWTYVVGLTDDGGTGSGYYNCPCAKVASPRPPAFVGNNYYCESGNIGLHVASEFYSDDALWDGEQCLPGNSCCDRAGQPWFFYQLPISETQHLEARICQDESIPLEAVIVEKLQLFVQ